MPCTACGNKGLVVGSKKPSTMILGNQRQNMQKRTIVKRPRGLVLNVSKNRTFILGRR
jgi:hypothetical protein|tara:strand:+ start:329 stop:502 length:174 start_codon:yes stop_codon:yes gene_type:complete